MVRDGLSSSILRAPASVRSHLQILFNQMDSHRQHRHLRSRIHCLRNSTRFLGSDCGQSHHRYWRRRCAARSTLADHIPGTGTSATKVYWQLGLSVWSHFYTWNYTWRISYISLLALVLLDQCPRWMCFDGYAHDPYTKMHVASAKGCNLEGQVLPAQSFWIHMNCNFPNLLTASYSVWSQPVQLGQWGGSWTVRLRRYILCCIHCISYLARRRRHNSISRYLTAQRLSW
jgi:hypothetical protein